VLASRILVVDDEPKIAQIVSVYLERDGYRVVRATDGREALNLARAGSLALVILDVMLPELSGWDVCRELRRDPKTADLPIIMLTARDDVADRIVGLELGADDYVVKPFEPKELVARVHAVLRRWSDRRTETRVTATREVLRRGDVAIDLDRHEVQRGREALELTPSEFEILATLAAQPGRVFSRLQLLDAIQGEAFEGYERTIDSHVKNLRRKMEPDPRHPRYVLTVFGVGYKLADQDVVDSVVSA
jgi:two-component system, OmpR family, alkaline phosphatase synthesis response regulator PhoP